jgi:hypothetical protein
VEKGDCAHFPSLLVEESRPILWLDLADEKEALPPFCYRSLAVSSWILFAERLDDVHEVGIGLE